jgi:ABC-2 type transport system permease protein
VRCPERASGPSGIFLSVVTQSSAAAIVGTVVYALVMEALAALVHLDFFRHYMLSSQLDAWQGLFQTPIDWTPVLRGAWVSALYAAIPLVVAFAVFNRRDVGGE